MSGATARERMAVRHRLIAAAARQYADLPPATREALDAGYRRADAEAEWLLRAAHQAHQ